MLSGHWTYPNVQKQVEEAAEYAAEYVARQAREVCRDLVLANCYIESRYSTVESPIEAIFFAWWFALLRMKEEEEGAIPSIRLLPQVDVICDAQTYRLDFSVGPRDASLLTRADALGLPVYKIGVELDGHEFHERTKEQVAHRNKRDRDLTKAGWKIFHFSGSELVRTPLDCVTEVYECGIHAHRALWRQAYPSDPNSDNVPTILVEHFSKEQWAALDLSSRIETIAFFEAEISG